MSHNCRCNKCKSVIYAMLSRIYGDIEFKPKFKNVSVRLEDYEGSRFYRSLSKIYYALSKYRGHTDFVRSKGLNPSDLYIPKKKILIETDEVQHFTAARFFALKNYPRSFELAYNIKVYRQMCKEINAKDGDGLTATDWAIEGRDAEAVRLLSGMGGRCDSLGVRNGQLKTIIAGLNFKPCKISEADWTLLEAAMDAGFSNEAKVHFMDCYEDANHDIHESWHLQLNLPGLAIYNADERLMHLCATHGWDINKEFQMY